MYHIQNTSLRFPGLLHQIVGTNIDVNYIHEHERDRAFHDKVYHAIANDICDSGINEKYIKDHDRDISPAEPPFSDVFFVVGPTRLTRESSPSSIQAQIYGIATVKSIRGISAAYIDFICTNAKLVGLGTPFLQVVLDNLFRQGYSFVYLDAVGYTVPGGGPANVDLHEHQRRFRDTYNSAEAILSRVALAKERERLPSVNLRTIDKLTDFYISNGFRYVLPADPFDALRFDTTPTFVDDRRAAYVYKTSLTSLSTLNVRFCAQNVESSS